MSLGVVIGKFYPFHRGHEHLIRQALRHSTEVVVIVCWRRTDTIPGTLRAEWIREVLPGVARVLVIDDRYDENDSRIWAANTIRWLGRAPDVVYTSEGYGDEYARHLDCRHVLVDASRSAVPCSGREIRHDPWRHWSFLHPPARAWYARRVCILGAESTGTTTLTEDLAAHYCTSFTTEYGRDLSEEKLRSGDTVWRSSEFVDVAVEQCRREDAAARAADRVLLCDTNAFATMLWHQRYMGSPSTEVAAIARRRRYDLYILTGDEIPFIQDGLRDGEHIRHQMHGWFEEALREQTVPWFTVRGSRAERLARAVEAIEPLLGNDTAGEQPALGPLISYPTTADLPPGFVLER